MAKRKKSRGSNRGLYALLALGVGVLGGLAAYVKFTPADRVPELDRRSSPGLSRQADIAPAVWVYDVTSGEDGFQYGRVRKDLPRGEDPRVFAANGYLLASKIAPSDARLVSVDVVESEAQLHFNAAFDQTYGSFDEGVLIEGLQRTFGQFPNVNTLRFYIEDRPMQTTGNIDLTEPVPVIR